VDPWGFLRSSSDDPGRFFSPLSELTPEPTAESWVDMMRAKTVASKLLALAPGHLPPSASRGIKHSPPPHSPSPPLPMSPPPRVRTQDADLLPDWQDWIATRRLAAGRDPSLQTMTKGDLVAFNKAAPPPSPPSA
jgi:hypothetical protein